MPAPFLRDGPFERPAGASGVTVNSPHGLRRVRERRSDCQRLTVSASAHGGCSLVESARGRLDGHIQCVQAGVAITRYPNVARPVTIPRAPSSSTQVGTVDSWATSPDVTTPTICGHRPDGVGDVVGAVRERHPGLGYRANSDAALHRPAGTSVSRPVPSPPAQVIRRTTTDGSTAHRRTPSSPPRSDRGARCCGARTRSSRTTG